MLGNGKISMTFETLEIAESLAMHLRRITGLEINAIAVLAACKASDEELADKYGPPPPNELDAAEDDLFAAALHWDTLDTAKNTETLHKCVRQYRDLLKVYLEENK